MVPRVIRGKQAVATVGKEKHTDENEKELMLRQ